METTATTAHGHEHAHAHDDHAHHHELSFLRKYLFSLDHKVIGIQYAVTGLVFLLVGFILMMIMRYQMAYPMTPVPFIGRLLSEQNAANGVLLPEFYNQLGAMHGTIMIFLGVVPLAVGGFGVYLDFRDAISRLGQSVIKERYGNLFEMYERITDENPYKVPMRIYPAIHYTMGGLWVDYEATSDGFLDLASPRNQSTNVPGLYAIGDVAGPPMLAHKAEHEGVICIETIKGLHTHPMDKAKIPGCTYCQPQIASVGLTEAKAKEQGFSVKVGRFPFAGNGKAIALGEPDGLVKTIFDRKTGQLLGAHMVGAEVTELIQGYVVAMNLETTEEELMHTIFPHPTLSETMKEAVLDAYGRVLNM